MCVLYMIKVLSRKAEAFNACEKMETFVVSSSSSSSTDLSSAFIQSTVKAGWLISLKKKIKILLDYATKAAGRGDNDERDNRALHQWPLPWVGE